MPASTLTQPEGKAPDTYEQGRTCAQRGCATKLSRYNMHPWCWVHGGRDRRVTLAEHRSALEELVDLMVEN